MCSVLRAHTSAHVLHARTRHEHTHTDTKRCYDEGSRSRPRQGCKYLYRYVHARVLVGHTFLARKTGEVRKVSRAKNAKGVHECDRADATVVR